MFYADLHVHSRFSRATSADGTLDQLSFHARRKGLAVLGTGDFTHPGRIEEIRRKLVPAEPGLFRLRPALERQVARRLPPSLAVPDAAARLKPGLITGPTRFMLQVEVSTIFKRNGRTRKVHQLVFVPDLSAADRVIQRLGRIGNLAADGRPILGLDSRDLLEIVMEADSRAFVIPAHIWTPWFSVLGAQSGFDSLEECYGDLAPHIFALETGLSSDPPMNWRVSALDRFRLVSNSDAHSPAKLGREACVFDVPADYSAMRRALETGKGFAGTVEFFPEEGKYHLDGHRKCGVRCEPAETRKHGGTCPVCGKPLTIGVLHRVEALADRPAGARPGGVAPFRSFIPLPEVLGCLLGVNSASKKVAVSYEALIALLGPELPLLEFADSEALKSAGLPRLPEAIERMRGGRVVREPGYDGEFGTVRLFETESTPARKTRSAASPEQRRTPE
jgi:DNA helicase-2/ATP-dependent DNA helicase PcrA